MCAFGRQAREVFFEDERAGHGEGVILAGSHSRGGTQRTVDPGVLPAAARVPILLVAAEIDGGASGSRAAKAAAGQASFALVGGELSTGDAGIDLVLAGGSYGSHVGWTSRLHWMAAARPKM